MKQEHKAITFFKTLGSLILTVILFATVLGTVLNMVLRRTLKENSVRTFVEGNLGNEAVQMLEHASSWLLMALFVLIFVLVLVLLILLNKRYLYKCLLYSGMASGLCGILGIAASTFPFMIEKKLQEYILVKVQETSQLTVKGVVSVFTNHLMQYSLILLGAGAAFLLLYMIIKGIVLRIQERRMAKAEAARAAEEAAKNTEETGQEEENREHE